MLHLFFFLKIPRLVADMGRLLPAFLLNDFFHNREPRVLRGLQHLELLFSQLINSTLHTVAFERA